MATAAPVSTPVQRTINRGANPFAPMVIQQNVNMTPQGAANIYEPLTVRGARAHTNSHVQQALNNLRIRLGGEKYTHKHFGELIWAKISDLDINIEIQRDEDAEHQANVLERFDPRIAMPVMATKLANGRYSVWEGQQTSCLYYHLYTAGLIDGDFLVQVKAFDEDMEVPGTDLQGEAVGNYGFRQINGGGRKGIDAYHLHRSRVNGVRLYASNFDEDVQSEAIQCAMEKNNMFPAKASDARGQLATPGMVTYIHGLNTIAGHGTDMKLFKKSIQDLEWALAWHNKYYPAEKGVDGGFILAFGRLHHASRTAKTPATLTPAVEQDLYNLFRSVYGSPKSFHKDCKSRLEKFQDDNGLVRSWSDGCLTPILVMDYYNPAKFAGKLSLPQVPDSQKYAGY
jgi:hypothetical protein